MIPSDLRHSQHLLGHKFNLGVNGPYVGNAAAVNESRADSLAVSGIRWVFHGWEIADN